jgi:type VI secretion system secreted protein VgrG
MAMSDFVFAWDGASSADGPWAHLEVIRFVGEEAMSRLFRFEIDVLARKHVEEPDPDELVGKRATLRIATQSTPSLKVVHGVITAAADVTEVPEGSVFRLVLEPPLARARYRKRCRIFLDKTLRQIIEAVLVGDHGMALASGSALEEPVGGPSYAPAREKLTFRVSKKKRLDDPKARPYVVQYSESDLDFVARLLEEEGISYHFESSDDVSLLVLSDTDGGRPRVGDDDVIGPGVDGREVKRFRLGGRLRAGAVRLGEYNWTKPALDMSAAAKGDGAGDLAEYAFPGGHLESPDFGAPLAQAKLDRLHTESVFAVGQGGVRVLSPGHVVTLEHPKTRYEGEYLITRQLVRGHQAGVLATPADAEPDEPFTAEFECACRGRGSDVAESRFRPERLTPRPRIFGAQTAFVTAEPSSKGAEINIGGPSSIGCVRLKFHWDTEEARLAKEPSSAWVRVSQPFARGGQGGIWHARVGTEVIVEFEEGDPDRPIITGRVYNGKNRPPKTAPTHSSLLSLSTPGGGVKNEITFEDTAGSERIYTNAGKDMTANVGNNRAENVSVDASMSVGANNLEQIGSNQSTTVGADDSLAVSGNQTKVIGGNRTRIVGGNRTKIVGANETRTTASNHVNVVGGSLTETVGGDVTESYGSVRTTAIASTWIENYCATKDQSVSALALQIYGGNQTTIVGGARTIDAGAMLGVLVGGNIETNVSGSYTATVGAVRVHVAGGPITNTAPSLDVNMSLKIHIIGMKLTMFALRAAAYGRTKTKATALISLRGVSASAGGAYIEQCKNKKKDTSAELEAAGVTQKVVGILLNPSGIHIHT